jgi:hypothetical protein
MAKSTETPVKIHNSNPVKALFMSNVKPYSDMGELLQTARAEATKILHCNKVKVLNILPCNYPVGYIAVVQTSGGKTQANG